MFPVSLSFYLAAPVESVTRDLIRGLLPDLEWGEPGELLRHSDEWPAAVLLVADREGYVSGERCDFPVEVEFLHFPGRVAGNDLPMLATKLALLRLLSATFECRVICDGRGFSGPEDPESPRHPSWCETFLCQGGRIYSGAMGHFEVREGYRPGGGWIALDDLIETSLKPDGSLRDEAAAVALLEEWIAARDVSFLQSPLSPIPPERPDFAEEMPASLTPEDFELESFEESIDEAGSDSDLSGWRTYMDRMEAWTSGGGTTSGKQLIREGIALPPPDSLDDIEVTEKLWEVIHGLAKVHTYLEDTNHLSDRELYTWLWEKGLNESTADLSGLDLIGGCHTSPIGSGDEESTLIGLIYYDSIAERAEWKAAFPETEIPAHRELPYDRDRLLPGPGYQDETPF